MCIRSFLVGAVAGHLRGAAAAAAASRARSAPGSSSKPARAAARSAVAKASPSLCDLLEEHLVSFVCVCVCVCACDLLEFLRFALLSPITAVHTDAFLARALCRACAAHMVGGRCLLTT